LNSDILANLFPDSDWSSALQWLDQTDIASTAFLQYMVLTVLKSTKQHIYFSKQPNWPPSHWMDILLPTANLNQLLIPFGNFYFFFKPSFSAHALNTNHTSTPNASPATSNSYTKVIYRLSTIMPMINPAQPSTQLKSMMRSNKPLMTLNSCPPPQILLLPPSSPTMLPKHNTLLTKMNTNAPSKHYAKIAPSLHFS
jgi:hypothetical protein